jgi:hypothetical protein
MVEPGAGLCDSLRVKLPGIGRSPREWEVTAGLEGWGFRAGAVLATWVLSARPH